MGIFQQFPYSNFHEFNLDEIIKIMRQMQDEWAATKNEWASYKDFIDNYFENLDVSEEVLEAMRVFASDGTLNTILDPTIITETAAWLADHITQPTTPALDTSLAVVGAAAESSAVGDKAFLKFGYNINDAWLAANNINDALNLDHGRCYLIQNVTKTNLANMPDVPAAAYNGALVYFKQQNAGFTPLLFIDNNGILWSGQNVGSSIRWKRAAEFNDAVTVSHNVLNNAYFTNNNITDLRNIEKNKIYIVSGVTAGTITNMPPVTGTSINGALIYFNQDMNVFLPIIFIDNLGKLWTGVDTGSTIRWRKAAPLTINENTSNIAGTKILMLGDSIMYGNHQSDYAEGNRVVVTLQDSTVYKDNLSAKVWSARIAGYLRTVYGCTVLNNSFPGARMQDLVTYYSQLVNDTYDFVIICLGVNNWNNTSAVYNNLVTLKSMFDATNTKMLVLTPLGSTMYETELAVVRDGVKAFERDCGVEIADLFSQFEEMIFMQNKTLSYYLIDGVHYTDEAQYTINAAAKKVLHI